MKLHCNVIMDLLPLYAEEMLSSQSIALVDEHLSECASCRKEVDALKKQSVVISRKAGSEFISQAAQIRGFKKKLRIRRRIIIILQIVLVLLLIAGTATGVFIYDISRPTEVDYGVSEIHSLADRKAAVNTIIELMEKQDNKLYFIAYSGDEICEEEASRRKEPAENIMLLNTEFRTSWDQPVLSPNTVYKRVWIMQREENGEWKGISGDIIH